MSDSQRILARYLIENVDTAAFLTAGKVGTAVGVSESTVVRFASALGYPGWPELQQVLADIVKAKLSTINRLKHTASSESSVVAQTVMSTDLDNLKKTMDEIKSDVFERVVELLSNARTIYVLGLRSARSLALFCQFYLQVAGRAVKIVPQGDSSIFEELSYATSEDIVLAISFPRYTNLTVKGFRYAKDTGARTIALTDSEVSPLAQIADISLYARTGIDSFTESFIAPLSLINAIVTAVGRRDEAKTIARLEKFEEICSQNEVYWTPRNE
jgi:DNA-binding MurR/RpiR family transcriptional regulator